MNKTFSFFVGVALMFQSFSSFAQQAGDLDSSFDLDGLLTTSIGVYGSSAHAVIIQGDGKIVAAGNLGFPPNGSAIGAITRYNIDGSLDSTFDGDGRFTIWGGTSNDIQFHSVAIQSDGKIVVAGTYGYSEQFFVARIKAGGGLDSTFDGDGKRIISSIYGPHDICYSMALQNDGKIVLVGSIWHWTGGKYDFAVIRLNSNGSLDATFDTDGKVTTSFDTIDVARSVAIQNDGKIVAAGYSHNGSNNDFALVRYNNDGSLDSTFDADGKLITALASGSDAAYSMAIQSDGKIVVAGISNTGVGNDFALVRYKTDGSLDSTFDSDGKLTTAFGAGDDGAYSMAIQSDGKIVVTGYSVNGTKNNFALARYNNDGSLDISFDVDGKLTTAFTSTSSDVARAVAIQSDGRIVVTGQYSDAGSYNNHFALARYHDTAFVVATNENSAEKGIIIYPNPSNGKLVIQSSERVLQIEVVNMLGEKVYKNNDGSLRVDISNQPQGLYFLHITSKEGSVVRKIVKE